MAKPKKIKEPALPPAPEPIVSKLTADHLRQMAPEDRRKLEENLEQAEAAGSRPEQTKALRASFNEMRKVRDLRALARERLKKNG